MSEINQAVVAPLQTPVMQHTRGPWCVLPEDADKPYIRIRGTALGRRYKIANVLDPQYEGAPDFEAAESRANARLIAAAPQQQDALLAVRHAPNWRRLDYAAQDAVLAALAAASAA